MSLFHQLIFAAALSAAITLFSGPFLIPVLRRLKVGQSIREEGPKSHLVKSGTPTMGGLMMILAIALTTILTGSWDAKKSLVLFSIIAFGLIGFADDYIKVVLKRNLGLRAYQKIIAQLIVSLSIALYYSIKISSASAIALPFTEYRLELGIFFIPFLMTVMTATTNSVNLTDGLDGLATGVTLIVAAFFTLSSYRIGDTSVMMLSAAILGSCLGFLKYNYYPARIFMGDTGSMALGGGIAGIAILMDMTLLIPVVGGIYFAEALSVILQVASFKITGKRIFKMSPLHHHFELSGLRETAVVRYFWIATVMFCGIGMVGVL